MQTCMILKMYFLKLQIRGGSRALARPISVVFSRPEARTEQVDI